MFNMLYPRRMPLEIVKMLIWQWPSVQKQLFRNNTYAYKCNVYIFMNTVLIPFWLDFSS